MADPIDLDDNQAAMLVENMAYKLRTGEDSRREFIEGLAAIMIFDGRTEVRDGPLREDGDLCFGQEREGEHGRGIWLPDDDLPQLSADET